MDGNVILGGDLNAKTNTENDFVSDLDDDHSPVNEVFSYIFDKPLERQNTDNHLVDAHGQQLLNMCKNTQVRILNGRTRGDRMGKFTRHPLSLRETPSTIDYMMADTEILEKVKCFSILPHLGLSDHECLSTSVKTGIFNMETAETVTVIKERPLKYASPNEFVMKLNSPVVQEKLNKFQHTHSSAVNSVEPMTDDLVNILTSASTSITHKKKKRGAGQGWKGKRTLVLNRMQKT